MPSKAINTLTKIPKRKIGIKNVRATDKTHSRGGVRGVEVDIGSLSPVQAPRAVQ